MVQDTRRDVPSLGLPARNWCGMMQGDDRSPCILYGDQTPNAPRTRSGLAGRMLLCHKSYSQYSWSLSMFRPPVLAGRRFRFSNQKVSRYTETCRNPGASQKDHPSRHANASFQHVKYYYKLKSQPYSSASCRYIPQQNQKKEDEQQKEKKDNNTRKIKVRMTITRNNHGSQKQ